MASASRIITSFIAGLVQPRRIVPRTSSTVDKEINVDPMNPDGRLEPKLPAPKKDAKKAQPKKYSASRQRKKQPKNDNGVQQPVREARFRLDEVDDVESKKRLANDMFKSGHHNLAKTFQRDGDVAVRRSRNRIDGIIRAAKRIREESEQIDELSIEKLGQYRDKAKSLPNISWKRSAYIARANKKISRHPDNKNRYKGK